MKKLTKLDVAEHPKVESANTLQEYGNSVWDLLESPIREQDHLSPNVGYWIIGTVLNELSVGEPLQMYRHSRNGVVVPGLFQTSLVTEIDGDYFTTTNSVYKLEDVVE